MTIKSIFSKKAVLIAAFVAVVILLALPGSAKASTLNINGTDYLSGSLSVGQTSGTIEWNDTAGELTLTGFQGTAGITITATMPVKIIMNGTNTLSQSGFNFIRMTGNFPLTFSGGGSGGGSLAVNSQAPANGQTAIYSGNEIIFESGTVTATGGAATGPYQNGRHGVEALVGIAVRGGTVTATGGVGTDFGGDGLHSEGYIEVSSGSLTGIGGQGNSGGSGMYATAGNITAAASSNVSATGGIATGIATGGAGGYGLFAYSGSVDLANAARISGGSGVLGGSGIFAKGGITVSGSSAQISGGDGGQGGSGIWGAGNITISGNNVVISGGQGTAGNGGHGIVAQSVDTTYNVTVSGSNVQIMGGSSASFSGGDGIYLDNRNAGQLPLHIIDITGSGFVIAGGGAGGGAGGDGIDGVTVNISGSGSISGGSGTTNGGQGIESITTLTITGGTLALTGGNGSNAGGHGIFGNSVVVNDGNVTTVGGTSSAGGGGSGIKSEAYTISAGVVSATGGTGTTGGVSVNNGISTNAFTSRGGSTLATGSSVDGNGIEANTSFMLSGGWVTAYSSGSVSGIDNPVATTLSGGGVIGTFRIPPTGMYLCEVTLSGASSTTPVTAITTDPTNALIGAKTDASGKLGLWLLQDTVINSVTTATGIYLPSGPALTAAPGTNAATYALYAPPPPPPPPPPYYSGGYNTPPPPVPVAKTPFPASGIVTGKQISVYKLQTLKTKLFTLKKGEEFEIIGLANKGLAFHIEQDSRKGYIAFKDIKASFAAPLKAVAIKKAGAFVKNPKLKRAGWFAKDAVLTIYGIDGKYLENKRTALTYWLDSTQWRLEER